MLLFYQFCVFSCKHPDKSFSSTPLKPFTVETERESAKPSTAIQPKPAHMGMAEMRAKRQHKKQTPLTRIETLMKKRKWKEADKILDEWNMKELKIKRELKSHIGLVREFLTGYDNCEQMEFSSSRSKKEIVDCYVKLLEINWNRLPQRSYFSREFAVYLTDNRNIVLKKLKRLRLAQDIEIIKEDFRKRQSLKEKLEELKKRNP